MIDLYCRYRSWAELDLQLWRLLWEWGCIHAGFCRCAIAVLINRSFSPIQIYRVQLLLGRQVEFIGTSATGYDEPGRIIAPMGVLVLFSSGMLQSPLDAGKIHLNVDSIAFSAAITSSQRETWCECKGGFSVGFLEKMTKDWWSKYVVIIS